MPGLQTAFAQGLAANRPAASSANAGYFYFSTDTGILAQSTGSAWTQVAAGASADALTTKGDVLTRTSSAYARLGVGSNDQVLTADSAQSSGLKWAAAPGFANPMTTQDDLIVGGASGAPGRLAKGADSQVLTVDPVTHHLVWATPSAGFSDPTTTKGDLIVHGASTTRLAVGSNDQVLTADSTQSTGLKWATPAGASFVGARVYNSASESISSGALTALTFNSERFDTDGIHSTVTNTGRLTCQTAGYYLIIAQLAFDGNATGNRQFDIRLNGTTQIGYYTVPTSSGAVGGLGLVSTLYSLGVGDYVECRAYQNSGGALDIVAVANYSPEFMMVRLG